MSEYKASAKKSFGEYKPLMIHPSGYTEILGKRGYVERIQPLTKFYEGPTEVIHYQRGKTFQTRVEAIAYAQKYIDKLEASIAERHAAYVARQERNAS